MSKYFKEIEYNMDADFLAKLDEARELAIYLLLSILLTEVQSKMQE